MVYIVAPGKAVDAATVSAATAAGCTEICQGAPPRCAAHVAGNYPAVCDEAVRHPELYAITAPSTLKGNLQTINAQLQAGVVPLTIAQQQVVVAALISEMPS